MRNRKRNLIFFFEKTHEFPKLHVNSCVFFCHPTFSLSGQFNSIYSTNQLTREEEKRPRFIEGEWTRRKMGGNTGGNESYLGNKACFFGNCEKKKNDELTFQKNYSVLENFWNWKYFWQKWCEKSKISSRK